MQSFCIILQKHIKSKKLIFSNNLEEYPLFSSKYYHEDFLNQSSVIHHIIYYLTEKNNSSPMLEENIQHKFKIFYYYIYDNVLLSKEVKNNLFDIFSKSQKIYFAFCKLANIFKYKKYKIVISDDLTLNPLDEYHKRTFVLIQNNFKYLFSLRDLINIIESSLLNNCRFFADPKWPKNPYNNVKLQKSSLYNIYFKLKETIMHSHIYDLFFLSNFSIEVFKLNNEAFLRDIAIKKFTYNSPSSTLRISIMEMLNSNSSTNKLKIHKDFPNDLLAEIFRPFLYNYLLVYYNFYGFQKNNMCENELNNKLHLFYKYNPDFGRKYIQYTNIFGKEDKKYLFNSNHINFYSKKITNTVIDNNCIYMLNVDTINHEIETSREVTRRQSENIYSFSMRSPNNTRNPNVIIPELSIQDPITSPNTSPNNSPTVSYSVESSISFIEIYNQINNQLTDDSSSENSET